MGERKVVETELKGVADRLVVLTGREEALRAQQTAGLIPVQGGELETVNREMLMRLLEKNKLLDEKKRLQEKEGRLLARMERMEAERRADRLLIKTVHVGFPTEGINARRMALEFSPREATVNGLLQAATRLGVLLIRGPPQSG